MPFAMTHLCIAQNIAKGLSQHIDSLPQFYLGNIAPDAVHNRTGYVSDFKRASHLCVGDEGWGMITNNAEWINNVIMFLDKHKNSKDFSFILGYCAHILSDSFNNITIWLPFKKRFASEPDNGYGGLYHTESHKIDINLALTFDGRDVFWQNIEQSKGVDFEDIIYADEIEEQKVKILYQCYSDKVLQDVSCNEVITYNGIIQFIDEASNFVLDNVKKYL